ncbi:hypothetical protein FA95DRAFT_1502287 [Auriscalpium vulgare]|uniref:Uncharacterized protein n=1 Tax=Auriscalpium vulgare TaxID=40419 RepID=A0ACB8RA88_9AGAM|nr:hypothetical protein FA95DRAFT_1502287 [Auriscalpium vulgare]
MVRRIASQVHQQASRLMRADYLKQRPAWHQAVLDHPPLPLPARAPPPRTSYDTPAKKPHVLPPKRTPGPRPLPVAYVEDIVRRQFFRDHPFESFRPRSLTEGGAVEEEHRVRGKAWTRLRQRGRNPLPEDAVRFAVSLHENHQLPLTEAYETAIAQFRSLRSEHHVATRFAAQEAAAYGATFAPGAVQAGYAAEEAVIAARAAKEDSISEGELVARKRWRAVVGRGQASDEWTRGEAYVRMWRDGARPDYSALTEPVLEVKQNNRHEVASSKDYMDVRQGQARGRRA